MNVQDIREKYCVDVGPYFVKGNNAIHHAVFAKERAENILNMCKVALNVLYKMDKDQQSAKQKDMEYNAKKLDSVYKSLKGIGM